MPRSATLISRARAIFGTRLKRIRLDAGLTQKELESLSGVPKSRISRYENGHLLPSLQGLRRLANGLDVPDSTLLGEVDDNTAAFVAALRRHGVEIDSVEHAEKIALVVAKTIGRVSVDPNPA